MTKLVPVCALLLFVFCASCKGKTDLPKDTTKSESKDTVTSYGPNTMVRNIKKGRNGTILMAASWGGIFRYDGNWMAIMATNELDNTHERLKSHTIQ